MLTRVTGIMGTLNYMSPEQATGAANIDHRTDIFAATVVLYELLTYLPAFNAKTEEEALRAVLHADAIPPSTHNPDLPPEIDDVVARGLAKSVDDRFESIEALHTAVTGAFKRHDALALSDQTLLRSDSRRLSDITPINVSRAGERSSESARHAQSESPAPSRSRASAPVAQSRETDRQPQVVPAPAAQDSRPVSSAARPRSWSRFATAAVVILLTVVAGGVTWWLTNQAEPPNARPPVGEPPPEKPAGATSISTSPDTPEKKGATSSPIQSAVPAKDGQQARKETPAQPEAKTDVSAQPSHTEAEDRAAIERTLTQLAQAYNRLDPEAAASLMVDEPVDEFRQAFARYTAVTMVLQPTSITVSGNGARVVSRERRTFTNLRGNTESGPEETVVYQFRRIGNTWRIAAREVQ
jgi:serine/threonine-protein kinase